MNRPVLVIVNPVAGGGRAARIWRKIRPELERAHPALSSRETTGPGDAERRAAEWARDTGSGAVIVVGGDGTIHEVVNGLAPVRLPVTIAVIPAGTGNDCARNAGIPLDPSAAAAGCFSRPPRRLDLGRLEFSEPGGRERTVWFVNSASVGVSPLANRHAQVLGRFLPGRLRYSAGGVLALLTAPRRDFTLRSGGRIVFQGKALNITHANGAGFGGGLRIAPGASPDDGALDRVLIGPVGLFPALLALARLRSGGHIRMKAVTTARIRESTTIESTGAPLPLESDGQDFLVEGRVTVAVEAGGLELGN